jgi:hypothetical protein
VLLLHRVFEWPDLEREIDQANTWKLDVRLELDVRLVGVR